MARMMRQLAGFGRRGILTLLFFVGSICLSAKETVLKVACVGDSITEGSGLKNKALESYPAQLGKILGKRFEVGNFGHSGRTLLKDGDAPYWQSERLKKAWLFWPDIVVIKLGTNDSKSWNWKHGKHFERDYTALIKTFSMLPSSPQIFLCRPVPAFSGRFGISNEVISTEQIPMIDKIAAEQGLEVIDLNGALKGKTKFFPDGIHPNVDGARIMAEVVSRACLNAEPSVRNYHLYGNHDQVSPIYEAGQKMIFTIKLISGKKVVSGLSLKWKRTGDDGLEESGESQLAREGCEIVTSTEKPGFVRIYATLWRGNEPVKGPDGKNLSFNGGACVAPGTLRGLPEPEDFDEFWAEQKKLLASVPLKVLKMKEVPGDDKVAVYDMKIACAGGMPVSGYLVMPINATEKSLVAEVAFQGYGVKSARKNIDSGRDKIFFVINAHGIENGKPAGYYQRLAKGKYRAYGFSDEKNSKRQTSFFRWMYLRELRALEYVKSLPAWNGKDLWATGGSQGGMQSLVAAGLDPDVTYCYAWSPWCCDFGGTEQGRIVGNWYVKNTPALGYFDPINFVKRANPKCKLDLVANLGDYVCPPSGVWVAFNNFAGPKSMTVKQGCTHGYEMPNFPSMVIEK